jgi:hypothetical protein
MNMSVRMRLKENSQSHLMICETFPVMFPFAEIRTNAFVKPPISNSINFLRGCFASLRVDATCLPFCSVTMGHVRFVVKSGKRVAFEIYVLWCMTGKL